MPYTPNPTWQDYPSVATLVTAGALNRIESGIVAAEQVLVPTATKVAPYTAVINDLALMNVAGGATTLTLPTAPADKSQVAFQAVGATAAIPLVVNPGAGDTLTLVSLTTLSVPLPDEVTLLQYVFATKQWLLVSDVKTLASIDARYAGYSSLVRNPDTVITGAITRDSNEAATTASVVWPDGTAGVYTATSVSTAFPGAVDAYTITYGSPTVLRTYTQPAVTRDAAGAAITVPAIVVS